MVRGVAVYHRVFTPDVLEGCIGNYYLALLHRYSTQHSAELAVRTQEDVRHELGMNKFIFAVIGLLMSTIAGVGLVSAAQHPKEVADAGANAQEAVHTVVSQVRGVAEAITGSGGDTVAAENTTVNNEAEGKSDIVAQGEADEDANESEDDGDNDDTSRSVGTQSVQPASATASAPAKTPAQTPTQPATVGTYTMAQVAAHNNTASCYTAIGGSVYDLTGFINQHPGGAGAILSLCGKDGTAAFSAQHGGNPRPANELASLKIGTLK